MSSDPTWPVAPVMRIMSSGPLLEMGFSGSWGAQPRRAGAAPSNDTLGQPTSSGVDEVRLRLSPRRRERLRDRRLRPRRCGPPGSARGCRVRRSARRRGSLRRRRGRRRRGMPGQSLWSAPRRAATPAEQALVRLLAMVAKIASPSAPPICWEVLISPEARPASCGLVLVTAAIVTGTDAVRIRRLPTGRGRGRPRRTSRLPLVPGRTTAARRDEQHAGDQGCLEADVVTSWPAAPAARKIPAASGR